MNPLMGDSRYQPLAGGLRAALPFVELLVSGPNLASLEALASAPSGTDQRRDRSGLRAPKCRGR